MYNNYGYGYGEPLSDQPMGYPTPQVGYSWGLGYTQQPPQQQPPQALNKAPGKVYGTEWNPSAYGYGSFENPSSQPQPKPASSGGSGGGASQYSEYQKYYYQSALQSSSPAAKPQQPKTSPAFGGYGGAQANPQSTANKWWATTFGGSTAAASPATSLPSTSNYSYNTSQYVTAAKNYYGRKQQNTVQPFSQYLDEYSSQQRFMGGAAGGEGGAGAGPNGQKRVPLVRKPPVDMSKFFCDVCKIQCGSDQVSGCGCGAGAGGQQ